MIEQYKHQRFLEEKETNGLKYAITGALILVILIATNC